MLALPQEQEGAKTGTAVEKRTLSICQGCPGSAEDAVTSVPVTRERDLPKVRMENESISLFHGWRILHLSIHQFKTCLWTYVVLKNIQKNIVIYTCMYIYANLPEEALNYLMTFTEMGQWGDVALPLQKLC